MMAVKGGVRVSCRGPAVDVTVTLELSGEAEIQVEEF